MSKYIEADTPSGVIGYRITTDDAGRTVASVNSHRGRDVELHIPAYIDGEGESRIPVTGIDKKAFLSDKYLHEVTVPDTVTRIGEWAFAGCRSLRSISLPRGIDAANGAFKDCTGLRQVELRGDEPTGSSADVGYLLAAVIELMDDRFLFDLKEAGSPDWIAGWDMRMDTILAEPDEEGFSALLACGEEDYEGRDNTLDAYLTRRRKRKVRICLVRLLHDAALSDERRDRLGSYLYEHRAGAEHPDAWRVVLEEHGDEEEYYDVLRRYGCIDDAAIGVMLSDMGDSHAGMKSYLIRLSSETSDEGFFDSFDLL
ncbi:MAG: leucine-rich repeat protein [Lachnospiraceae bacterium]|nr:leucine-rich repeat protein [Lachnospiraceae bacterium]